MDEEVSKRIDTIMDGFDFAKVHKAMQALDWVWRKGSKAEKRMTVSVLRDEARSLLERVSAQTNCTDIGAGGFYVRQFDTGGLELQFRVATADSGDCYL